MTYNDAICLAALELLYKDINPNNPRGAVLRERCMTAAIEIIERAQHTAALQKTSDA